MTVAWSHSALKDYENCARKYHEVRVLKKFPFDKTEQILYGESLHKAAEDYVRGSALPEAFKYMQPIIDSLMDKGGEKSVEIKMALDASLQPCDWFDKKVWVRGIADFLSLDFENKKAWIVDYKTGSNKYPDTDQLELMALLTFAHYPDIDKVNAALLFVVKESITKLTVRREDAEKLWWKYRERVAKIESSHSSGVWNPKQSGLCKWCAVTSCEFNPKH
jgi:hypothetical protein